MTAADRPSVTDNARAAAEKRYPNIQPRALAEAYHEVFVTGYAEGWAAAGRAETTTATTEDAARVIANYLDDYLLPANYNRPVSGETHRAVAEHVAPLIVRELDRHGLLATARTRPTREQIANAIGNARWGDEWLGVPDAPLLHQADAVMALLADQPETTTEWGVRTGNGHPYQRPDEASARRHAAHLSKGGPSWTVVRREVGPWTEAE